jgi:uncharacterized membrane protein
MDKLFRIDVKYYLYFALIIGLVLRLFNLNYEGLWNDELFTADTANPRHNLGHIIHLLKLDIHPPLHNILSHYWSKIFSYSDTSLRMFNVLLGLWGIVSMHHLGKLLFNKKVAMYAVLLATVNYFLIRYSQEVRAYGLLFLLSNYSFYFFVKLMRGEITLKNALAYGLITAGLLYTHYFGMFVMAAQFLASFVIVQWSTVKKYFWKYALTFLSPILLFLLWLPVLKVHLARNTKGWRDQPNVEMILTYPQQFFNDYILAFIASALVILTGIYLLFRRFSKVKKVEIILKNKHKVLAVLFIWTAVYFLIPYLKSSFSTSMMVTRYFIVMVAPIILIVSFYLSRIKGKSLRNGILAGVLGYSLLLLFLNESPYYSQTHSYREIVGEAKLINNDAPVLFLSNNGRYFEYYLRQNDMRKIRANPTPFAALLDRDKSDQYFVFLDLRPIPKAYLEEIPVMEGYEAFHTKTFANKHNIKTAKLIQYRKIKDSL